MTPRERGREALSTGLGFTLIELMIAVAIIGVLTTIALPRFSEMLRHANEGATKGNLGSVRTALTIYYGDMDGQYPRDDLHSLEVPGKYLAALPYAKTPPFHGDQNQVSAVSSAAAVTELGGWAYVNNNSTGDWGVVLVDCTHTDHKGRTWTSY